MDDIAATRAWIEKAKTSPDEIKAEIIDMLGRKGDIFAVNFINENLNSPSANCERRIDICIGKITRDESNTNINCTSCRRKRY